MPAEQIAIMCNSCGGRFRVSRIGAQRSTECPKCRVAIAIPALVDPAHATAAYLVAPLPRTEAVSVAMAGFLNWVWQGAGYFVIGQNAKGAVFCVLTLGFLVFDLVTCGFGLFFHIPYNVGCIIDAVLLAQRINRGETIGEWTFF